jgi:hypothetical protein
MTSLAHFESVARAIDLPNRAVIAGRLKTSVTRRTFDDVTPRNGAVINRVVECDAGDVDLAVAGGRRAFEDGRWRSLHYREKKRILFATSPAVRRLQAIRIRSRPLAPRHTSICQSEIGIDHITLTSFTHEHDLQEVSGRCPD